jgi:hypothetical protein
MPTRTDPKTGLLVGVQDASSSNADLVEILQTFSIPDGSISGMIACEPPNLVGRRSPVNRSQCNTFLSLHVWRQASKRTAWSIRIFGGQWFALFHQGTFQGFDIYVCSQVATFVIPPIDASFAVTRSDTAGAGNVSIHFSGTFSD